jgi:ribosome biogenesis GTPase
MKLSEIGFERWFSDQARELSESCNAIARVTAVDRGWYQIRNEQGDTPAELTGKFLHDADSRTELPCVGDWVCVQYLDDETHATIHHVLQRKSWLRRKNPGRDVEFQMIAANVDAAFIVQSCHFDFNVRRLERYLVMVNEGHVEPIILLTKTDLVSPEMLEQQLEEIRQTGTNARIMTLSNVTGEGIEQIRELMLPAKTYCLIGSSGVGKTTLINRLQGDSELETGAVSHTGEGRHTTTRRQLIVLEQGGLLIDMPGMRELGMLGVGEEIDESFSDIQEFADQCRFSDCSHTNEPGCAVKRAIKQKVLNEEHVQNYLKLRKETAFHELSHVEKRKKDRTFGKFIHTSIKSKGKRGKD